ncbi:MAG: phosphopantetheine-binding protein, partial [Methylococcales bacterium]
AVLRIGGSQEDLDQSDWLDWHRQKLRLSDLRGQLTDSALRVFAFRNIPNARLFREVNTLAWLREAGPDDTVGQLKAYLDQQKPVGVEPEDLECLAREKGFCVELSWLNSGAQGAFDAVFSPAREPFRLAVFARESGFRPVSDYANHPQRDRLNRQLIPRLRTFIQEKLPQYMMPAVFTVLEKLPLTPTGKIDRKALEQLPLDLEPVGEEEMLAGPRTPFEKLLAEVWTDVLNLRRIGLDDDFFALGGNSLKAMLATNKLQRLFNRPLQPLAIFKAPTISGFASHLLAIYPDLPEQVAVGEAVSDREEGEI